MPTWRFVSPRNLLNGLVDGRKAVFVPLGLMVAPGTVPQRWTFEVRDECIDRLRVLNFQKWAWVANLAIHTGFSYCLRARRKPRPRLAPPSFWQKRGTHD